MSPGDPVYVGHMLDMARKAVSKTQNISPETYDADENLRLALIHLIQTIGEAARQGFAGVLHRPSERPMGGHHRGKLADMVVLADDLLTMDPNRLKEARIDMTIVAIAVPLISDSACLNGRASKGQICPVIHPWEDFLQLNVLVTRASTLSTQIAVTAF